jgi:hypothetical protein
MSVIRFRIVAEDRQGSGIPRTPEPSSRAGPGADPSQPENPRRGKDRGAKHRTEQRPERRPR